MSVPPGTEMFQFPGFASAHYVFMYGYPCGWVAPFGYPRINACSRLPVAFRSVPRPSSPPGAKASTECPYDTRYGVTLRWKCDHHARKPSSDRSMSPLKPSRMIPPSFFSTKLFAHASEHICHQSRAASTCVPLTGQTCDRQRAQRRTRT